MCSSQRAHHTSSSSAELLSLYSEHIGYVPTNHSSLHLLHELEEEVAAVPASMADQTVGRAAHLS